MYHRLLAVIAFAWLFACPAYAQDIQSIASDIDKLQSDTSLDEETRSAAISALTAASQNLSRINERAAAVRGFIATAATAEQSLRDIRRELEALQREPVKALPAATSIQELNTGLAELLAESGALETTIRTLREREATLNTRVIDIAKEITNARKDLDELTDSPPAENAASGPLASANAVLYNSRVAERQAAIDDLSKERTTLAARQELGAARLNLAMAQSAQLSESISRTQERLGTTRGASAKALLEKAQQRLVDLAENLPVLQRYAQENVELARANLEMVNNYAPLAVDAVQLQQDLSRLTASAQTVDQVLATGQLNNETAELLRDVLRRLPNESQLANTMLRADQSMVTLRLNQVLWQDRLRNILDSREVAERLLAGVNDGDLMNARQDAMRLVEQRQTLLRELSESARDNSKQLGIQRQLRQDILNRTSNLARLLDRHLLWLPTKSGFGEAFVPNLISNIAWITSPRGWLDTAKAIVSGFSLASVGPLILAILALALGMLKNTLRHRLEVLATRVGRVDVDTYMTTPEALALSLLLTLPWALAIAAIGLASVQTRNDSFTIAIGEGFLAMAAVVFILVFFRTLGRHNGVFHRHFGWSEKARAMFRFHLNWFIAVEAIVAFVFSAALASGDLVIKYGIGRLAFMVSAIAIALFAFYFLKPRSGIVVSIDAERKYTAIMKALFGVLVLAPLIIGILPAVGYFEAAIEIQTRIFKTGIIVLLAAVIYRLSMRVFMVGHRRMIAKQELEKRAREQARIDAPVETDHSGDASPQDVEEDLADLDAVERQSRRVIYAISIFIFFLGLWGIWGALLPALGIANDIILWDGVRRIDGVAVTTGISLWDFSVSMFLIIGGFVLARNIAGILELAVFERVTLTSGTRYAAITIARYIVISFGIVVGLSRLGLDWSSLQWVIAALGVGLGFGLQEIVANFVSGLIILFERPIRVGDIVSIGQLDGTVTSIQIRATRITDFDNREVLMPNKSIITENVTNWTLNDQVTRIIIKIGVAYGSDIDKVRSLIMDTVTAHPDTLSTPGPAVFFMAHGDSSLDFEARVFVATPTKRLPTTHDLNRSINMVLAENDIEIPFPQRDLHMRTGLRKMPDDEDLQAPPDPV